MSASPSWSQLTYGSREATPGRPGGWGVIDCSPGLQSSLRDVLEAGVVARLDGTTQPGDFADRAELEARPRRLTYCPAARSGAFWHTVPAGKDATNRPGNVFTHAAYCARAPEGLRPADLWRSPDWMAPFGARETTESRISDFGSPGPLGRPEALALVLERPDQVEAWLALVARCLTEDEPLFLIGSTADELARWVSVASHLTAASVAWQFPFLIDGTASAAPTDGPRPGRFQILALSDTEAIDLRTGSDGDGGRTAVWQFDVTTTPSNAHGRWSIGDQSWSSEGLWPDALFHLRNLPNVTEMSQVLASMDVIAADVAPDAHLDPGWPLALALLRHLGADFVEARELADQWRRLQPWDGLSDEAVLELLSVDPTADAGIPFARMIALADRPDDLVVELARSRVAFETSELRARQGEIDGKRQQLAMLSSRATAPDSHRAVHYWLQVAPILCSIDTAPEEERPGLRRAVLIQLGLGWPEKASQDQASFADQLMRLRALFPPAMSAILADWQQRRPVQPAAPVDASSSEK